MLIMSSYKIFNKQNGKFNRNAGSENYAFIVSYWACIAKQFWKKAKNFSQNCVC
jgi:hypothetical protein